MQLVFMGKVPGKEPNINFRARTNLWLSQTVKREAVLRCHFDHLSRPEPWQAFFAVQVVNGFLSFPFFFFMVPILRRMGATMVRRVTPKGIRVNGFVQR